MNSEVPSYIHEMKDRGVQMCLEGVNRHLVKCPSDTAAKERKRVYEAELVRREIRET